MQNSKRKQQIELTRNAVGWIYPNLPWFSEEEALEADRQRSELLEALSGWIKVGACGSKLHSGPLSPGCAICAGGYWGCNFINGLCTRNCFYCPQDRSITAERESFTDNMIFKSPADHIAFIKTFHIRGVGFSGGEPLLVLNRLLRHIEAIRGEFGKAFYLWMYTNGDQVDRGALARLQSAGLNEIRFNLSARGYDVTPAALAKEYIPTVTVEIPAIPEDFELVTDLLGKMETAGADFLNLHQLYVCSCNYKAMGERNYHFLHQPSIPVFESELCALRLLAYAREHGIRLPINYCCAAYKNRFQGRGHRMRQGKAVLKGFEELTRTGYIRSIRVTDSAANLERMVRLMEEAHCPADTWQCDDKKTTLGLHSDLLPYVDWSSADVAIVYFHPGVKLKEPDHGISADNLQAERSVVYQESGWSATAVQTWHKLYIQKANPREAFKFFYTNYPAQGKGTIARLQKESDELKKIAAWEELETGLPQVF